MTLLLHVLICFYMFFTCFKMFLYMCSSWAAFARIRQKSGQPIFWAFLIPVVEYYSPVKTVPVAVWIWGNANAAMLCEVRTLGLLSICSASYRGQFLWSIGLRRVRYLLYGVLEVPETSWGSLSGLYPAWVLGKATNSNCYISLLYHLG